MELIRKEDSDHMYVLGDDGLKKLDFQFLDEDFVFLFHEKNVSIPKDVDKVFYEEFSKLFENRYLFRDNVSYQKENEISWVSDEYKEGDSLDNQNRLVMIKKDDSIDFICKNDSYEKKGVYKRLAIVEFSPMGMGRYSRNLSTGNSFQEDMINTFNYVLNNPKKKGKKK